MRRLPVTPTIVRLASTLWLVGLEFFGKCVKVHQSISFPLPPPCRSDFASKVSEVSLQVRHTLGPSGGPAGRGDPSCSHQTTPFAPICCDTGPQCILHVCAHERKRITALTIRRSYPTNIDHVHSVDINIHVFLRVKVGPGAWK